MESYGILDAMGLTSRIVLDANIYTMNNRAESFWIEKGILGDTVPLELNAKELAHRNNKNSELIVYGYTPNMNGNRAYMNSCLSKSLMRGKNFFRQPATASRAAA